MSRLRKATPEALAMPTMVILVGLAAFGLGRLSVDSVGSQTGQTVPVAHRYVGSKSGSVYYLPRCKGAQGIKDDNKVWFGSAADAQAAGYQASATCPGL